VEQKIKALAIVQPFLKYRGEDVIPVERIEFV
jgi:stage V sporulation protein SpoVS